MAAMTQEQEKFHAVLVEQYGLPIVTQARHLSGLTMCLQALAVDELSGEERKKSYIRAGMHLAQMLEMVMSAQQSAKVTECAGRIDAALDVWMVDEIEARDGLPDA